MYRNTPIKVLHYNTAFGWRGGEQQVLYLTNGLKKYPVHQYAAGQPNDEFLQRISVNVNACVPVKSRGEFNPIALFKLINLIKKNKIDIVHTHSTPAHSMALQAKFIYSKFKLIVHRRVDFRIKNNALSLYKYKSEKVDKIIAISQFIKNLIINQGIPENKIDVIYSGVDPHRFDDDSNFDIRSEYNLSDNTIILGNVAALTAHKDHLTLIKAMRDLEKNKLDFVLFILGEGEQRENIVNEIYKCGLKHRIKLTGFQQDIGKYLKAFDILVHSSCDEGLGTSIIDALAQGIPVVATDAGGIPEILGDHQYGLVAPKRDPEALAQAIIKMITNEELRAKFQTIGPERAKFFTVENMVQNTYRLYNKIMDSV